MLALTLAVCSWAATAAPAAAKTAVHVTAHVSPATAYIGSAVQVSGTAKPAGSVEVDRLVGKVWKPLLHAKTAKSGAFSVTVKVPRTVGLWSLRVVRGTAVARLRVTVTKVAYKVSAKAAAGIVNNGSPIVVTGTVPTKTGGTVWLQQLALGSWHNLVQAKIGARATYALQSLQPAGSYRLRVFTSFSKTVAGGASPALTVVVLSSPAIVTTSLPAGTVGHAYAASLAATSGEPPYTWSVSSGLLPAGLTLSAAGALAGLPTAAGTASVTFMATDSHGQGVSQALGITIEPAYGPIWAWGLGTTGALGNGATINTSNIVPVSGLTNAIAVSGGGSASYAVLRDHTVWAWGGDEAKQLGDGLTVATDVPHQVPGLTQMTSADGSISNGYALRADGTVWAWGLNTQGQLGDGTILARSGPVQVVGLSAVTAIAATGYVGYALRSDGTVWAWGYNGYGQLGNGGTADSDVAVQVGGVSGAVGIAAGLASGYALLDTGKVMAWGFNGDGELGDNSGVLYSPTAVVVSGITQVVGIASGYNSGYAMTATGSVWAWGVGSSGELGNGGLTDSRVPVQVTGLTNVVSVAGGSGAGYAVLADGTVRAWGGNSAGGLGNGTSTMSALPVQVSGLTGVARVAGGAGWALALQTG